MKDNLLKLYDCDQKLIMQSKLGINMTLKFLLYIRHNFRMRYPILTLLLEYHTYKHNRNYIKKLFGSVKSHGFHIIWMKNFYKY